MSESETVCIECGSSVDTAFENRFPGGEACPTCRRRAMDALPSLLPSSSRPGIEPEAVEDPGPWSDETPVFTYLPGHTGGDDDGPIRA